MALLLHHLQISQTQSGHPTKNNMNLMGVWNIFGLGLAVRSCSNTSRTVSNKTFRSDDDEFLNYKDRIKLAHSVLGTEPPKTEVLASTVRRYECTPKEKSCTFPLSKNLDIHFKESWKAITGDRLYLPPSERKSKLAHPTEPAKLGRLGKSPKEVTKNRWYKVEGEDRRSKPCERWPFKSWDIDDDFVETFKVSSPSKYSTMSDWMDELGKILGLVNQLCFFSEAAFKIVESGFEEHVKESGKHAWEALDAFTSTGGNTLDEITSATTNLMLNMLVRRREEVIKSCKLEPEEANLLRFAAPQHDNGKLFRGTLPEFREWKAKRAQTEVLTECIRINNSNKRKGSFMYDKSGGANKKAKSSELEERLQSFRDQRKNKGKKDYNKKAYGGGKKKGKNFQKTVKNEFFKDRSHNKED